MATNNMITKGQCMNFGACKKADAKEVIEVNIGEEFICPECKCQLLEVKPRTGIPKWLLACILIIGIGGGGFLAYTLTSTTSTPDAVQPTVEVMETDTPQPAAADPLPPENVSESKPATPLADGLDLGYAVWTGKVKDGKAHGANGRMVFKERHRIDPRDDKTRYAEAGEYIVGEYEEGKLIQGQWHKKDKNVEFISIGQ